MKVIEPDYINTFSEKFHLESKNHSDFIFETADKKFRDIYFGTFLLDKHNKKKIFEK